ERCRAITRPEIAQVIEDFAEAAAVAVEAGFDAVELHFGHNYLPSAFLSPWYTGAYADNSYDTSARSRLVLEIAAAVRARVGDRIAVLAKVSMVDGVPGGITLAESLRTVQLLDADGHLDAVVLTQGSSVVRQMLLFRGDVPVADFAALMPQPLKTGVYLLGRKVLGEFDYHDLYMLESARQFVPVVRNTQLILLGGVTEYDHLVTGLDEGFAAVAIGRALLREPDLIETMRADRDHESLCTHCNRCMYTVYGRTHCVLDPAAAYGPAAQAPGIGPPLPLRPVGRGAGQVRP